MLHARVVRSVLLGVTLISASTHAFASKLTAPVWDVYVVDEAGKPVVGIAVTEQHQDLTCESRDHMETQYTDVHGHVQFAARYLKANAMLCAAETSTKAVTFSKHKGRHATVFVGDSESALVGFNLDKNGKVIEWLGKPDQMKSKIVVKPRHAAN